ncbi:phage protein Gp27 family protein [Escherichia coli]|uniref:phage protein Gp27 family protein n=1 Tax=Escherichia coli TaxID=562 RepID=UPI001365273C
MQNKRGRISKIELLPKKIKRKLDKMLISREYSQAEVLNIINQDIVIAGCSELLISRTGLNRYASSLTNAVSIARKHGDVSIRYKYAELHERLDKLESKIDRLETKLEQVLELLEKH